MKKLLFVAVLALASITAYAQPRAIGANLGGNFGVSYQHGFGEANMLDVAVYVPWLGGAADGAPAGTYWGIGGIVIYDWIDPFGTSIPWSEQGEWHWYMGVGGAGGLYNFSNPMVWHVGAAGHIGVEYDFWFPLQLSLDWRPNIGIAGGNGGKVSYNKDGLFDGITLGVRYKF